MSSTEQMTDSLTVRVQLSFNQVLHPEAIAMLAGLNKKVQADVIAGLVQLGALARMGADGGAARPALSGGAPAVPASRANPAPAPAKPRPAKTPAPEAVAPADALSAMTPAAFSIPAEAFNFSGSGSSSQRA